MRTAPDRTSGREPTDRAATSPRYVARAPSARSTGRRAGGVVEVTSAPPSWIGHRLDPRATGAVWTALPSAGEPLDLAVLDRPLRCDVAVVGLGASGLSAVRRAVERGADVVGIDRAGVAAGAAGRNGGFLLAGLARWHHEAVAVLGRPVAAALYRSTLDELERTAAAYPGVVRRTGSLRIAASDDERDDCTAHLRALHADGFAAEAYDGPEGVGLLLPDDGTYQPIARCRTDARAALAAGARLFTNRATDVAGGRVETDGVDGGPGPTITADAVVVAVDGDLERLVPELRGEVASARLQMLATAPDRGVALPRPVYRRWGFDYVQQVPSGEVLLGGARDVGGEAEWDAPAVPSPAVQDALDAELRRLGATAPVTHRWAARAAFTVDGVPVCRRLDPGTLVVGAYSGHGNLLGPLCGRAAADAGLDGAALDLRAIL